MAERRMFNKSVVSSDEFLEMPDSTQCLYFHLSMNADDDGFVDKPKGIIRMIGAKEDDLRVLITKSFVLPFETGVIVIKHWKLNNYIQKDRKRDTIHQEELSMLKIDNNGAYTLGEGMEIGLQNEKQKTPLTIAQQKRFDAKKESDLPYSFEYKIKSRFIGKKCPICGKIMNTYSKKTQPTIQHNIPISKGGKHEINNISIICGECNYSIQDNETEKLNNDEVVRIWNEIKNENVSGMDTQYSIGKDSIDNIREINKEKKTFEPPTLEDVIKYAEEKKYPYLAKKFYDYFTAGEWVDSKGQKVKNWKQKFITWAEFNKKNISNGRVYKDSDDFIQKIEDVEI